MGRWSSIVVGAVAGGAIALTGCGVQPGSGSSAQVASASWPQCSTRQMQITAKSMGAALGHAGVLVTLRNTSSASCRLAGYPGIALVNENGKALPTTVVPAVNGSYLIRKTVPHRVALPPGASASFDLEYSNVPVGAQASEPPGRACPAATKTLVRLPNAAGHSVVRASMAPCGDRVLVSPVVPGTQWLRQ